MVGPHTHIKIRQNKIKRNIISETKHQVQSSPTLHPILIKLQKQQLNCISPLTPHMPLYCPTKKRQIHLGLQSYHIKAKPQECPQVYKNNRDRFDLLEAAGPPICAQTPTKGNGYTMFASLTAQLNLISYS